MSEILIDAKIMSVVAEARKAYQAPRVADLKGQPDYAKKVENYTRGSSTTVQQKPVFTCTWRR